MTEPLLSPLAGRHADLGASLTDFGGWLMPLRYESDLAEHHAVRTRAGLFDVSHMAAISVGGRDAAACLDYALAGMLSAVAEGRAKYTMMLADDGGVIDDLIVYRRAGADFLVIANAANRSEVVAELERRAEGFAVDIRDETETTGLLALQGPAAERVLELVTGLSADDGGKLVTPPSFAFIAARFMGHPLLIARTGYTGEDGFELIIDAAHVGELWDALLHAGAPLGLIPCGLAARDSLRLEAGMPLYGHELSRAVQPAQAGWERVIPATKTSAFVGAEAVRRGPAPDEPRLVGLRADGRRAARAGYSLWQGEREVGVVTSGALSPTLGYPIALAYVAPDVAAVGTALEVDVRGSRLPVRVVRLPFIEREQS